MINVLALSEEKIDFLLTNHKYFTSTEIKLAAKIKVMNDKKHKLSSIDRYSNRLQQQFDGLYGRGSLQGQAQYSNSLGQSLFGNLF